MKGTFEVYNSKNPFIQILARLFLKNISCLLYSLKTETILDIGCGEGDIMYRLKLKKTVGIDNDKIRIHFAKRCGCHCIVGDIYSLPIQGKAFKIIIATEILEHLDNYNKALNEIRKVCQQCCLISVPYEPFFQVGNFLRGKHLRRLGKTPAHVNFWRKQEIVKILKAHFKIVQFRLSFPWLLFLCEVR